MPPRQPDGTVENRHYVSGAGGLIGVHVTKSGAAPEMRYYHRDHLGSIVAITNEAGAVTERLAYEAFGKRRFPSGTADPNNNIFGVQTERGFTGHEHLDEIGLVHMNGRVYDPLLGRFMTADPFVQSPRNLQSYNRYSYVWNNPLSAIDPTGYSRWTNFRDNIAIPAAAITIAVFAPEISAFVGWTGGVEAGAAVAGGFSGSIGLSGAAASGMLGGALAGGVLGGTWQSAFLGAFTGGAFGAVGSEMGQLPRLLGISLIIAPTATATLAERPMNRPTTQPSVLALVIQKSTGLDLRQRVRGSNGAEMYHGRIRVLARLSTTASGA